MWLVIARMPKQRFLLLRVGILILCVLTCGYFLVEITELDGSNDEDSEAEALCSNEKASSQVTKRGEDRPLPVAGDSSRSLMDSLLSVSSLKGWTTTAKLHLDRGPQAVALRAVGCFRPQAPLTAFAARSDSPIDPA